jgi:broad-specificity NMP kinase
MVAEQSGLTYINVGDWVKQHELHSGYDEEHEALIIDEDKVRPAACLLKRF